MTTHGLLNQNGVAVADEMAARASSLRIEVLKVGGAPVLDCGIKTTGSLRAGIGLARVCLANLGDVHLVPGEVQGVACPLVHVETDHPVSACMASQYAGWQVAVGKYFAMGSGPMRALHGKEA